MAGLNKRIKVATGVALVGIAGAAGFVLTDRRVGETATPQVTAVTTGTAEIRRVDIAQRQYVNGTLGYEGTYQVIAPGQGVLSWLPPLGTVVSRGGAAYETDGKPVVLMYGGRPAWRAFELGMDNGADVEQLEANLKELGYGAGLTVDQHFTAATSGAVRRWQTAAKLTVTGTVQLGQVLFMPGAVRVGDHDIDLGERVEPGALVEHGTSNRPAVTVPLSPQQLPNAKVGNQVMVILPDGKSYGGAITQIGAVVSPAGGADGPNGNNQPTAPVTVRVDGDTGGFLDQSTVRVAITVRLHPKVLAVPVTSLNAVAGGGYEVIVIDGATTRRVPVETGLFDESSMLAEVSGPGLAEGLKVQVPNAGQ
jgi:peptidoglycan hydrolase-like protein with peptidoglycan-binding domain